MIPYFENCPHSETGWCLECVSGLGNKIIELEKNNSIKIKVGMAGGYYPEDFEYLQLNNFNRFVEYIKNNSESKIQIKHLSAENLIFLEFDK